MENLSILNEKRLKVRKGKESDTTTTGKFYNDRCSDESASSSKKVKYYTTRRRKKARGLTSSSTSANDSCQLIVGIKDNAKKTAMLACEPTDNDTTLKSSVMEGTSERPNVDYSSPSSLSASIAAKRQPDTIASTDQRQLTSTCAFTSVNATSPVQLKKSKNSTANHFSEDSTTRPKRNRSIQDQSMEKSRLRGKRSRQAGYSVSSKHDPDVTLSIKSKSQVGFARNLRSSAKGKRSASALPLKALDTAQGSDRKTIKSERFISGSESRLTSASAAAAKDHEEEARRKLSDDKAGTNSNENTTVTPSPFQTKKMSQAKSKKGNRKSAPTSSAHMSSLKMKSATKPRKDMSENASTSTDVISSHSQSTCIIDEESSISRFSLGSCGTEGSSSVPAISQAEPKSSSKIISCPLPEGVCDIDTIYQNKIKDGTNAVIATPLWLEICCSTTCTNRNTDGFLSLNDGTMISSNLGYLAKYGKDYYDSLSERDKRKCLTSSPCSYEENNETESASCSSSTSSHLAQQETVEDEEESVPASPLAQVTLRHQRRGKRASRLGDSSSTHRGNRNTPESSKSSSITHSSLSNISSKNSCNGDDNSGSSSHMVLRYHPDLTPQMRAILIDWLVELCEEYKLQMTTMFIAIRLVDLYLSCPSEEFHGLSKNMLQCLGCSCLLIASKMEEIHPPKVNDFVEISDSTYTRSEIIDMEMNVCLSLQFRLQIITPYHSMHRYILASSGNGVGRSGADRMFIMMVQYLLELSLMSLAICGVPTEPSSSLPCPTSSAGTYTSQLVMASAVYLSRATLGIRESKNEAHFWSNTLIYYTSHDAYEMEATVTALHKLQNDAETSEFRCIFNKYSKPQFLRVALKTVLRKDDLGFN